MICEAVEGYRNISPMSTGDVYEPLILPPLISSKLLGIHVFMENIVV